MFNAVDVYCSRLLISSLFLKFQSLYPGIFNAAVVISYRDVTHRRPIVENDLFVGIVRWTAEHTSRQRPNRALPSPERCSILTIIIYPISEHDARPSLATEFAVRPPGSSTGWADAGRGRRNLVHDRRRGCRIRLLIMFHSRRRTGRITFSLSSRSSRLCIGHCRWTSFLEFFAGPGVGAGYWIGGRASTFY